MQNIKNKLIYLFQNFFSPKEILLSFLFLFISFFSLVTFIYFASTKLLTDRILYSGSLSEAIIESPKNTNPYKSDSQVDKDVSKLLYATIIKNVNGEKFDLRLAKSLDVSSDKQTYKLTLRENIYFSNGSPITADDIIYSLDQVPLEKNYTVEKIADDVLTFKIKKAGNTNFLDTLTYPIISKQEKFDGNFSTSLITSNFFKIKDLVKDADGNLTKIVLERYDNGEEKLPYIKNYTLNFYKNESDAYNAYQRKEIDLLSGVRGSIISKIKDDSNIALDKAELPNNFAIFINQNNNEVLRDADLRQAMSDIIDRTSLTNQVLGSFGIPMKYLNGQNEKAKTAEEVIKNLSPIFSFENGVLYRGTKKKTSSTTKDSKSKNDPSETTDREEVKVSITTLDNPELVETAKFIQNSWKKIGITTEIKTISRNDLNSVVKDRDFENLLFGFSIKNAHDYYSFFESSERTYPKLNIANYTSKNADKILDTLVGEEDPDRKKELIDKLSDQIGSDNPVIILYKPEFVFAHFLKSHIILPKAIKSEEEKYLFIEDWYTDTEKVFGFWQQFKFVNKLDTYLY